MNRIEENKESISMPFSYSCGNVSIQEKIHALLEKNKQEESIKESTENNEIISYVLFMLKMIFPKEHIEYTDNVITLFIESNISDFWLRMENSHILKTEYNQHGKEITAIYGWNYLSGKHRAMIHIYAHSSKNFSTSIPYALVISTEKGTLSCNIKVR